MKEIQQTIRSLLRNPGFTAVAVITLTLAIGVNTTIFSVVNAVLLKALPFQQPEQLVSVQKVAEPGAFPGIAAYEYLVWKDRNTSFDEIAAFSDNNFNLTGLGEPERISCAQVTASLFTTLKVQPLRGRFFLPEEDKPGTSNVAIISERFWQQRFARNEAVLQNTLTLDDKPYSIVGVMPASFRFPGEFDIWVPIAIDPVKETQGHFFSVVEVVGRIKPLVSATSAQTEFNLLARQMAEQMKEPIPPTSVDIVPLHKQLVSGVRLTVLILWGAVGLVMLLAGVNVASLMISRTLSRQREMAVRAAIGARRWQLIRQLLTESVVLGLAGGVLGLLVAVWGTRAIAGLVPQGLTTSFYDLNHIPLDLRVFVFTFVISVLTGIVFGLAPALTASKPNLIKVLRGSDSRGLMSFGLRSVRGWLVVAELALAVVLLLGAGLLVRSFNKLMAVDLGFDRENVLTFRVGLPRSRYPEPAQTRVFFKDFLQRVNALPGVQTAGAINHAPLEGHGMIAFMGIEGHPPLDRKTDPAIGIGVVDGEYFKTLKIPLLDGRQFDARDGADGQKVAIVNQAFVKRFLPQGAIGKRVGFACEESEGFCRSIIGVVGNIRQESITDEAIPEMYVPFAQMPINSMQVMVRTSSNPLVLAGAVRKEVLAIDSNQPIHGVMTLAHRVDEVAAVSRSLMLLFTSFALLAVILGAVGIYGIVSYSVTQRTREIGIRMALGARAGNVLSLIMRNGFTLVLTGIVIGVAGAFALTRFLTTMLFGVTPTDSATFVFVSLMFFVIAMIAALIPALRATRVDPLVALRYE